MIGSGRNIFLVRRSGEPFQQRGPIILDFPNPHKRSERNAQGWSFPTVLLNVPSAAVSESLKVKPYDTMRWMSETV
jgi:hypothetical protein